MDFHYVNSSSGSRTAASVKTGGRTRSQYVLSAAMRRRLKSAIRSQLNGAIVLCDVIPDRKTE